MGDAPKTEPPPCNQPSPWPGYEPCKRPVGHSNQHRFVRAAQAAHDSSSAEPLSDEEWLGYADFLGIETGESGVLRDPEPPTETDKAHALDVLLVQADREVGTNTTFWQKDQLIRDLAAALRSWRAAYEVIWGELAEARSHGEVLFEGVIVDAIHDPPEAEDATVWIKAGPNYFVDMLDQRVLVVLAPTAEEADDER